jgi:hypothetical protein
MKFQLPEHIETQLHRLIAEGLPADQIAFMMKLDRGVVEEAMNTPKNQPAHKAG